MAAAADALEEAGRRARALQLRARQLGVCAGALGRLAAARGRGRAGAGRERGRRALLAAAAGALTAALAVAAALGLLSKAGLARALLRWRQRDVFAEQCALPLPEWGSRALRPPVDCAMCSDVHQVDRLANVSPALFEHRYAYSGRPLVVTDATEGWSAPRVFSLPFFRDVYARAAARHTRLGCQFFPYDSDFTHLLDALNMSEARAALRQGHRPWYIGWSNCEERVARELRRHYDRPYFLPANAEAARLDWIFMGSRGYGARMHVDNVQHPSWQAQLRGRKRWQLQPPPECFYACRSLEVTVDAGEVLVLDTNRWYHQTTIVSDDMSITVGAEFD